MQRTWLTLILVAGCPMPSAGDGEGGDNSESDVTTGTDSTGTDEGGCPVGVEGCPCTDANTCFPQLGCVDGLCVPAEPCPIGSTGCPCTNAGTCDLGSTCTGGVCECEFGDLGCACLNGGCSDALDCVEGLCSIPELVGEAANGWGPVTCWGGKGAPGPNVGSICTAARGDVVHRVRPACEIAKQFVADELMPFGKWAGAGWPMGCADGLEVAAAEPPWDDAGCYLVDGGIRCMGRIGHLWVDLYPECAAAPMATFDPWGDNPDLFNCPTWPVSPPAENDVDEWRCGPPGQNYSGDVCLARYSSYWTLPLPPCAVDPDGSPFADFAEAFDGWSVFMCL